MPTACHSTAEGRSIVWRLPLYNSVHNILTNPVYAGAYAFGRTTSKVNVEGRKRVRCGVSMPQLPSRRTGISPFPRAKRKARDAPQSQQDRRSANQV